MRDGYEQCYYSGALGGAWNFVHRAMEKPFAPTVSLPQIIELGAGQGQHAPFVRHAFDRYVLTDLRSELIRPPTGDPRFEVCAADAMNLHQFDDGQFDRVIATCLLVHLPDPLAGLREWRRIVRPGGHLTIYVPCEPGMLTRFARQTYIWPKARRHGLHDPELMMYEGHKIHFPALRTFLRRTFVDDTIKVQRFPTRFAPWNAALFDIYQVRRTE